MPKFDNSQEQIDEMPQEGAEDQEVEEQEDYDEEVEEENYNEDQEVEIPEKFRDKSKEDVVKSYVELEKLRQRDLQKLRGEAQNKANEAAELEQQGRMREAKEAKDELNDIIEKVEKEIEDADYSKMDPKEYGKFLLNKTRSLAETIAERKVTSNYQTRKKIHNEIREVKKEYPEFNKENDEFRELVLDTIRASKAKGHPISLKEAVGRVSRAFSGREKKKKPKNPKDIEKTRPTAGGVDKSEERRVKEGILNAGNSRGELGGM